jgi:hypothetical protein
MRSAIRPAGTSSAAKTIAYALRIQDSSPSDVPEKSPWMSGKAMLTMVTSRNPMNAPADATTRTCHLRATSTPIQTVA